MDIDKWVSVLGFTPKENTANTYSKQYLLHGGYCIDVDFGREEICYNEIVSDSKTTQNFSQPENFVVLECVDRLLTKGYKPENIILEKVWRSGHGTSGRLDVCVTRDDGSPYLLIECKTYGKEFDRELANTHKNGGQLFTYFQLSGGKADIVMLYAAELKGMEIVYRNEIIKIEDEYRSGETKDIYEKWNKLTKDNGIFDSWVQPYNFRSRALTKEQLREITSEDSSFIFNRFLEILRHNVVSDKGNAFNKIFTLFLCKVYDETSTKEGEELQFQWKEGIDNHVDFQLRLTDLYGKGMQKFLGRKVSDFDREKFDKQYNFDEEIKKQLIQEINKIRLEKNNEFAIKEVYDTPSFEENARVVKEVVELIQRYRIRYNKRQQYLSDFFELLLTTGLKQEAGQFFTPVPVAQFIIKSLPLDDIVADKLKEKDGEILPYMIDYAAGSGHFLTEYMHEVQGIISQSNPKDYIDATARKIKNWQDDHFDWATQYVYGVEKDYRLVKVGKVGCYLHGDGLANVILSDGLANFNKNKEYKGKLRKSTEDGSKDNQQFDVLLSNPPYSVSSFRQTTRDYYTENDFELYESLTDNSSEIECLFVERTKQLLKDGGVAGVILPSSILSNAGIYTKAREMILQYFDIVAIAELGSNTFMATGTNTVVLFLRRRNNYDSKNIREAIKSYFKTLNEVTVNGIEKPVTKYVAHVWEGLDDTDYVTLLQKLPNDKVKAHEVYTEYRKKIRAKDEVKFWQELIALESEKLTCFIIAFPQRVVLVKTGEKDAEKRFLGYEFSNRRGNEGIHSIQRGKTIAECTKLFDENIFDNPEKASTYIYRAFKNDYDSVIADSMQGNVSRVRLVDMLTFDRVDFEKTISTAVKKKVRIESKWVLARIGDFLFENDKSNIKVGTAKDINNGDYPFFTSGESIFKYDNYLVDNQNIYLSTGGNAVVKFYDGKAAYSTDTFVVKSNNEDIIKTKFIFYFLESIISVINEFYFKGVGLKHLQKPDFRNIQIPLPPLSVQQQTVAEIEVLEKKEADAKKKIEDLLQRITHKFNEVENNYETFKIGDICEMRAGDFVKVGDLSNEYENGLYPCYGGNGLRGFTKTHTHEGLYSLVGRQGALCGNVHLVNGKFHATEHALVVTPKLNINTVWLYHKLISMNLNQYAIGTAQPGLSVMNLAPVQITVPSLADQQKIVSEIEALEKEIDRARETIDKTPAQKAAVLKKYL